MRVSRAKRQNHSLGRGGQGKGPGDSPPQKTEGFKNTLPLIFKAESILNPLRSFSPFLPAFLFEFAPKCSQVRARRKFAEAVAVPQRPLWGGTRRNSCAQCSRPPRVPRCPGQPGSRIPTPPAPNPAHMCRPSPSPSLWSRFEAI